MTNPSSALGVWSDLPYSQCHTVYDPMSLIFKYTRDGILWYISMFDSAWNMQNHPHCSITSDFLNNPTWCFNWALKCTVSILNCLRRVQNGIGWGAAVKRTKNMLCWLTPVPRSRRISHTSYASVSKSGQDWGKFEQNAVVHVYQGNSWLK